VRVPHSPNNDIKAIWSLAITWNPESLLTTGMFDGASHGDAEFLAGSINAEPHFHPLCIPLALLEMLMINYTEMRRELAKSLVILERDVGLIHRREAAPWNVSHWDEAKLQAVTKEINLLTTHLAYMERRFDFTMRFAAFLQGLASGKSVQIQHHIGSVPEIVMERLANAGHFLDNSFHHIKCLQKRAETVINVVSPNVG
jgi:hypothetical protein